MSPRLPFYLVHVWTNDSSHFVGYSSVTSGYYITQSKEDAEQFLNIKDAVESFEEFCDTHKLRFIHPKYEIIGYNINLGKP